MNQFDFNEYWEKLSSESKTLIEHIADSVSTSAKKNLNKNSIGEDGAQYYTWGGDEFLGFILPSIKRHKDAFSNELTKHIDGEFGALRAVSKQGTGLETAKISFCYAAFIFERRFQAPAEQFILGFIRFTDEFPSNIKFDDYEKIVASLTAAKPAQPQEIEEKAATQENILNAISNAQQDTAEIIKTSFSEAETKQSEAHGNLTVSVDKSNKLAEDTKAKILSLENTITSHIKTTDHKPYKGKVEYELRFSDQELFDKISDSLTAKGRRKSLKHFKKKKIIELKGLWEGYHLIEFGKIIRNKHGVTAVEMSLASYAKINSFTNFISILDSRNAFPKKKKNLYNIFVAFSHLQGISFLECLSQFLIFCKAQNYPLSVFDYECESERLSYVISDIEEYIKNYEFNAAHIKERHTPAITPHPFIKIKRHAYTALVASIICGLVVVSSGIYSDQKVVSLSDDIKILIPKTRYPNLTEEEIIRQLGEDNIPDSYIIYVIKNTDADKSLNSQNVQLSIEKRLNSYNNIKSNKAKSKNFKRTKKIVDALIDKGEIDSSIEIVLKRNTKLSSKSKDIMDEKYDNNILLGQLYEAKGDYRQAINAYLSAFKGFNGNAKKFKESSVMLADAHLALGKLTVNTSNIVIANSLYEMVKIEIKRHEGRDKKELREIEHKIAKSFLEHGRIDYTSDSLEKAAKELNDHFIECKAMAPNLRCYEYLSTRGDIFFERGAENVTTKEGRAIYASKLKKAVESAYEQKRHATSSNNQEVIIEADVRYRSFQARYAIYAEEYELLNSSVNKIKELFRDLKKDFEKNNYNSVFIDVFNFVQLYSEYWDAEELLSVRKIYEQEIESYKIIDFQRANNLEVFAMFLRGIWLKKEDVHLMEEAIKHLEKSFSIPVPDHQLSNRQLNFGIVLSDYGYNISNDYILERSIMTFKKSSDNSMYPIDRKKALEGLKIVLNRLKKIKENNCYQSLIKATSEHNNSISELVIFSNLIHKFGKFFLPIIEMAKEKKDKSAIIYDSIKRLFSTFNDKELAVLNVYLEPSGDDWEKSLDNLIARLKHLYVKEEEYNKKTHTSFKSCFPNILDLPGLQAKAEKKSLWEYNEKLYEQTKG